MKLNKIQKQYLKNIGRTFDLKLILLHGSHATGTQDRHSDLDIAVLAKKPIQFNQLLKISSALEKVFGNIQDRELDVSSLHGDDPLYRYKISKSSVPLYGKPSDYHEFRAYAFQSYLDAKDLFRLQEIMIQKYQNYLRQKYA